MAQIINFLLIAPTHELVGTFYKNTHKYRAGGYTILIHDTSPLIQIINNFENNSEFRVLVHMEFKGKTNLKEIPESQGWKEMQILKRNFPKANFAFFTREIEIFPSKGANDGDKIDYHGFEILNGNEITFENFFKNLPINRKCEIVSDNSNDFSSHKSELTGEQLSESSKKKVETDFTILTALAEDEYEQFSNKLEVLADLGTNKKEVRFKNVASNKFADYDKSFFIMRQERMGMVDAMAYSTKAIFDKNPKFLVMAGVCGGRKGKVKLYDIIIPSQTLDLVTGKIEMVNGEQKHVLYNYSSATSNKLIEYLKEPERITLIKNAMFALVENSEKKYNKIVGDVNIHFDDMACVPYVVNVDGYLEQNAKAHNGKICGLEMESYGVLRSNTLNQNDGHFSMVIKSIMDFTDGNKADSVAGENIKETAAYVSYLCTRAIMPHLTDFHSNKLWLK